ncbi:GNAT family N-acetyltransferase, partial [Streptomyces sp. IF17]|nr:GNAT family N-acetyltransferase [Streptomyces alkaliphilus]
MRIRRAGEGDVAAASAILGEAFEDDPLLCSFVPRGPDRRAHLT